MTSLIQRFKNYLQERKEKEYRKKEQELEQLRLQWKMEADQKEYDRRQLENEFAEGKNTVVAFHHWNQRAYGEEYIKELAAKYSYILVDTSQDSSIMPTFDGRNQMLVTSYKYTYSKT